MRWLTLYVGMDIPGWEFITKYYGFVSHLDLPKYHGIMQYPQIAVYFGLPKYHGIMQYPRSLFISVCQSIRASCNFPRSPFISVCQNIMASCNISKIAVYFGLPKVSWFFNYLKSTSISVRQIYIYDDAQAGYMSVQLMLLTYDFGKCPRWLKTNIWWCPSRLYVGPAHAVDIRLR